MIERPTILILTSKTGGGHISLAGALQDLLEQDFQIEIADPQPGFIHLHYRLVSRYALWLWAAEFRRTDTPRQALIAHRLFTVFVARRLSTLIARLRPAVIITTYPFLSYEVAQVLNRLHLTIPLVLLFADPNGVHASWLTEREAEATFAPTRETYRQAIENGFQAERVHLVGWPVRGQFLRPQMQVREDFLRGMGLDAERFTIFLQGGGEGAAKFAQTVERVLQVSEEVQVILAMGTNQRLYERFRARPRLYALPFTRDIAAYMAVADVVMGKAGPNMLFESVAQGKPFIATTYIPGQEWANLEFIRRHGLGWVALTPEEQGELLLHLVRGKDEFLEVRRSVEAYWAWNVEAMGEIVSVIRALIV